MHGGGKEGDGDGEGGGKKDKENEGGELTAIPVLAHVDCVFNLLFSSGVPAEF